MEAPRGKILKSGWDLFARVALWGALGEAVGVGKGRLGLIGLP